MTFANYVCVYTFIVQNEVRDIVTTFYFFTKGNLIFFKLNRRLNLFPPRSRSRFVQCANVEQSVSRMQQ